MSETGVLVGLSAVIVAVRYDQPCVFIVRGAEHGSVGLTKGKAEPDDDALPFGPFDPEHHRTLELGLRSWVSEQTPFDPGYIEQLYTFGNRGRYSGQKEDGLRVMSVGYLALTHEDVDTSDRVFWGKWYTYFPWEDWREGRPEMLDSIMIPMLKEWAVGTDNKAIQDNRLNRIKICFASNDVPWDEERVLQRYELLYEARLIPEALRDKNLESVNEKTVPGRMMQYDHRRILATAMTRLRGKLKYKPVIFELMPESFTLFELQKTVEAISGNNLHKQNFRRLVEGTKLVEETGQTTTRGGGRPAALFQFRSDILPETRKLGVKLSPIQ